MSMFADEAKLEVIAGRGGDGAVAFRRESMVARGGPSGGDGGRGGDVIVEATHNANTLYDYRHQKRIKAENGRPGGSKQKTGRDGESKTLKVPVGTLIRDADSGEIIADLTESGQRVVIANGGAGGKGNTRFKSSTNRAPRRSTPGKEGEEYTLELELKLIADVGLVGYPSVGKSTLIAKISSARPKTGAYHFTTLTPNLGVVKWKGSTPFVVADIPGLIEGAHRGEGLGHQFLRHVERTRVLVHVLEVIPTVDDQDSGREPIADYEALLDELRQFNPDLLDHPQLIVLNKIDLPYVRQESDRLQSYFEDELGLPFLALSAATGEGIDAFKDHLARAVSGGHTAEPWELDK